MSLRTSATRYARALLDVAMKESDPSKIERELTDFALLLDQNRELRRVLLSPGIPTQARRQIVGEIAKKANLDPPLAKLLVLLADRGRLELVPDLLEVYRERLLATIGIVKGSLTSAAPLSSEKVQALARSLSRATGKQVQLEASVDPSLIGGVVTRVSSTVYDGSIRTQLQKMKKQLVENA
jgi:F-type H+-transporting ATPase subunit delta